MLGFVPQPNLQDRRSHYKIGDRTATVNFVFRCITPIKVSHLIHVRMDLPISWDLLRYRS
jgi:hypothetical protein